MSYHNLRFIVVLVCLFYITYQMHGPTGLKMKKIEKIVFLVLFT